MKPPHIVGVVGNDIINDSRVKKVAASAAAAGFKSSILCYTPGETAVSQMGDVTVVRVSVPFHVRDLHRRVPAPSRPLDASELNRRHAGPRTRRRAKIRRLQAEISEGGSRRSGRLFAHRTLLWLDRQLFRLRRRWGVTRDRGVRVAYRTRTRMGARLLGRVRNPVGHLLDYEMVFGPELEALEPDLIHAHDYHMIGVAVNAARFLRSRGRDVKVVYDAHELVEGLSYPREVIAGWSREESSFIHDVDAVTGVSAEQVGLIQKRYGLSTTPRVVHNAPLTGASNPDGSTIRDTISAERILVYHGNVAEERGVFTLVEALVHTDPGVHVVIVAPPASPVHEPLLDRARELRVEERVHLMPFVPPDQLTRYLESADIAVIPYLTTGNNDIALPNKLFEAIQAGLPVLTSNMTALSRFVHDNHIGRVFAAGDPVALGAEANAMLADLDVYRSAVTPEVKQAASWSAQADALVDTYRELLGVWPASSEPIRVAAEDIKEPDWVTQVPRQGTGLAIGPRNMAGQAYELARAVSRNLEVSATSFGLTDGRFEFEVDHAISSSEWHDPVWQERHRRFIAAGFSHVLTESGTGLYGSSNGGFVDEQLDQMRSDGLEVAVLLHGSEIRDPRRHRLLPSSPYATESKLIRDLNTATSRLRHHLEGLDVPMFVTTPDLRADVDAEWLPVVIDTETWESLRPAFELERPVVLHMPTNGLLKGSEYVDEVLFGLRDEGLVEYLRPTDPLRPGEVAALIERSDIVIDGIVLGAYGVMSCQTMAAGRIAIANIRDVGTIRSACPIVDADPSTLDAVIRELVAEHESWPSIADAGQRFVSQYHDGTYSSSQLARFLGV